MMGNKLPSRAAKRAIIQEIERLKGSPKPAKLGQPIASSISPFANGFGRSSTSVKKFFLLDNLSGRTRFCSHLRRSYIHSLLAVNNSWHVLISSVPSSFKIAGFLNPEVEKEAGIHVNGDGHLMFVENDISKYPRYRDSLESSETIATGGCESQDPRSQKRENWKGENRELEKVVSEEKQVQMPNLYSLEN
ncbi:hypothetical protein ACI3LX_000011 [Candidozyma auris]